MAEIPDLDLIYKHYSVGIRHSEMKSQVYTEELKWIKYQIQKFAELEMRINALEKKLQDK